MTREEALKMQKAKRECILKEIDPSGGCNDEKCDGCDLNYEQGCMGEQAEALHVAIKSLEAWEKVKEEIKFIREAEIQVYGKANWNFSGKCLGIIDKYLEELDGKNEC